MQGVLFSYDTQRDHVLLTISPAEMEQELTAKSVLTELCEQGYDEVYLSESAIKSCCEKANNSFKLNDTEQIVEEIGERKNAVVEFRIAEDGMFGFVVFTAPYGGRVPTAIQIKNLAVKSNIRRGVGIKRIQALLNELANAKPGSHLEGIIAKGLPPKNGHSSRQATLVPNALERVLRPQTQSDQKVDMRNLGEVICVKANTPVLRRMPPSKGRSGFDVRGNTLPANTGEWIPITLGSGTAISDNDENLVVSTISGMPKYREMVMQVDDTFICNGVNVGTGHINYDGSVLVNGDVTEQMQIKASGDVTVNGYVESATIEADGDIIITEGAVGKQPDEKGSFFCKLSAGGSLFLQHGQSLDIICSGQLSVKRQLAYSRISAAGISVGHPDKPQGNLFACDINSQGPVAAGILGAVSGSHLNIDFGPGLNVLQGRKEQLDQMLAQLRGNAKRHQAKIEAIKNRKVPKSMFAKVDEANELLANETALLMWMEQKSKELSHAKAQYISECMLIANTKLYPGVLVKLNNRHWRSEREYGRATLSYREHQWHYEPIV